MANELKIGVSRHGFIFDGLQDTPNVAVQLTRFDDRIELQLPWLLTHNPEHRLWFGLGGSNELKVPELIEFVDVDGPVALVGCYSIGARDSHLGVGVGRIGARYAIVGARSSEALERINGLRSEIEGLGSWVGLSSVQRHHTTNADGRITAIDLRLEASPSYRLPGSPMTELRPWFSEMPGEHSDERVVTDRMLVETRTRTPSGWRQHLDRHFALRDLVRLAAWRSLNFVAHYAQSNQEPLRSMADTGLGKAWNAVETPLTGKVDARSSTPPQFLFSFADVSLAGIGRWMDLYENEARLLQPVLRLLDVEGASLTTHMAQLGTGLEALGYRFALEANLTERQASNERLADKIERITTGLKIPLPDEIASAPQEIADAYNAVKHPNRRLPERFELENAYLKGVQLFRIWAMEVVGVKPPRAADLLRLDPITYSIARTP